MTRYSVSEVSVKLHILIRVKIVTRFSFSEVSVKLHFLIPVKIVAIYGGVVASADSGYRNPINFHIPAVGFVMGSPLSWDAFVSGHGRIEWIL